MDRYLASLRASSPTYEDPFAYWGGARPALQYGLPPEQPRPDTAGWPSATTGYGMGHTPAGMPPLGAPPPVVTGPGGPRPSTPTGTTLPQSPFSLQSRYNAAADRARGYNGENGMGRAQRWLNDLYRMATPQEQQDPHFREWAERYAQGGVRWAETHEPGFGPTGFAHDAATPENTYNPGQALAAIRAGQDPAHVQADARGLSVVPGQGGAADPAQRAADHITRTLSGGTTGGATMPDQRDPTYHATPNNMGATGVPATGAGGGGMDEEALSYLWADPNRMRSYIMQRGGLAGQHNSYSDYFYNAIAPLLIASLRMKGTAGDASLGSLEGDLGGLMSAARTPGSNFFGGIANQARGALHNQDFLGALGGISAEDAAQRLNSIIGLTQVGNLDNVYAQALAQRAQDATQQLPVWLAGQHGQGSYIDYMKNAPWLRDQPWLKGLIG